MKKYLKNITLFSLLTMLVCNHMQASTWSWSHVAATSQSCVKKNALALIAAAATGAAVVAGILYWKNSKYHQIENLIATMLQQKQIFRDTVSDDMMTMLYRMHFDKFFIYNKSEQALHLKKLCEEYNVITPSNWTDNHWNDLHQAISKNGKDVDKTNDQSEKCKSINFISAIHVNDLPALLSHAKSTLKSFVPTKDYTFSSKHFIDKKDNIWRLFTYAKLQRIIEEKKLSHIRLPLKCLVIHDKISDRDITGSEAYHILDTMLKVCIGGTKKGLAHISLVSEQYEFRVWAHRQPRPTRKLSEKAMEELSILVQHAPFDVGYDNIFADENGDAIIIDTEYKCFYPERCLESLERYR